MKKQHRSKFNKMASNASSYVPPTLDNSSNVATGAGGATNWLHNTKPPAVATPAAATVAPTAQAQPDKVSSMLPVPSVFSGGTTPAGETAASAKKQKERLAMFKGLDLDGKKQSRQEHDVERKRNDRAKKLAKKRELIANRQAQQLEADKLVAGMKAATEDMDDDTVQPHPPPLPDSNDYELVEPVQQLENTLKKDMAAAFSAIHEAFATNETID